MSTWIRETERSWWHRFIIRVLKSGPIPKHVAFIMDGNRRYAKKNNMGKVKGHSMGFEKLAEALEWCLDLGITEVTVYAFSIENFKRTKEEVDGLMELARQKFEKLMQEKELIEKHGVRFRVLGNLTLLPVDIQEIIAEAVLMTKNNNRATLNVCFSYTSRDEICTAMREAAEGVELGLIKESDISEDVLERCFYTNQSPDPDLLVRTSGEVRLSDFLLWQTGFSVLSFMTVLWPEFSIWHMYGGVIHYQRNCQAVQVAKQEYQKELAKMQYESDYQCVVKESRNNHAPNGRNGCSFRDKVERYKKDREDRIETFIKHVEMKRLKYFQGLVKNKRVLTCS